MTIFLRTISIALLIALTACTEAEDFGNSETDFRRLKPITKSLLGADKITIYEGLPHPGWERQQFQQEAARVAPLVMYGHSFYSDPIKPNGDDSKEITQLFIATDSLVAYQGPKGCGGFHADWGFEWQVGQDKYLALLCFNCQEMNFFGPTPDLLCEISLPSAKQLKALLEQYRSNRPKGGSYDSLLAD